MKKIDHWKDPRGTIAYHYKDNDYGYVFHASSILIDILEFTNLSILNCKTIKVLDYGCGTGRIARQMALTGAHVEAYDPVKECIEESKNEFKKIGKGYKTPKIITDQLENISNNFDLIFSVSVLEHLDTNDFNIAISNMENLLKENGTILLWIHVLKNSQFCKEHNLNFKNNMTGIGIIKGIKHNGIIDYLPVYRK